MYDQVDAGGLRLEVERLLSAAIKSDVRHDAELQRRDEQHHADTERRDQLHVDEIGRRDELHVGEIARRDQLHVDEMVLLAAALESRDTIGQAKGVIIATMGCSSDEAFKLLREQSQHENRKLTEIAAEIVERAQRTHRRAAAPTNRGPVSATIQVSERRDAREPLNDLAAERAGH